MPKKFSEQERERIRQKLLEAGTRQFGHYGIKKTSVEDLTKAVGIAQGTFYLFFGSKEELFFVLLQQEEERIRERMMETLKYTGPVAKQDIAAFLKESLHMMAESPIVRQIYEDDQFEQLIRKLPPEQIEQNLQGDVAAMLPVVSRWQEDGLMRGVKPEIIVNLIRMIVMMSLNKQALGDTLFDETMEMMIELVAEGMVRYETGEVR